jgi:hypothetical protein
MTYVALNLAYVNSHPGFSRPKWVPANREYSYSTVQPLATEGTRYSHHLPRSVRASYSSIGLSEGKLTHDEACGQLKGPRSSSLHWLGP